MLTLSSTHADPRDLNYLAAVPAATHVTGGQPSIIVLDETRQLADTDRDFLRRYQPAHGYMIGRGPDRLPHTGPVSAIAPHDEADPQRVSRALAEQLWTGSERIVVVDPSAYEHALVASSLAARLRCPLLFSTDSVQLRPVLDSLGVQEVLWIGPAPSNTALSRGRLTRLLDLDAVSSWLVGQGMPVDYLALTNVADREGGRAQKMSLSAAMLAARRQGMVLPVDHPIPTPAVAPEERHPLVGELADHYAALGHPPEYLALVGHFDSLPVTRYPSIFGIPVKEHPVSDFPYADIDPDPFADISIGRIVAHDIQDASLLVSRISTYEQLEDGHWDQHFIETGRWGYDELRALFENVGFGAPEHLSKEEIKSSSTIEAAAILHKDHSYTTNLGHAFDLQSEALLAPSVVMSNGCRVAGMDLVGPDDQSIVTHLIGRGAVAFVGASRDSTARNTLIQVSMWNQVLAGRSIGHAFKDGWNEMLVHWLDEGHHGGMRYSVDIEMLFGDPAMRVSLPAAPRTMPAHATRTGDVVSVTPPQAWTLVPFVPAQLSEWNYSDDLFMYVGPGASPLTYWAGAHDREELYFNVALPLGSDSPFTTVVPDSEHPAPLGWGGGAHIDEHHDGSRTLRWRVRLLDYDMSNGDIMHAMSTARFRLERATKTPARAPKTPYRRPSSACPPAPPPTQLTVAMGTNGVEIGGRCVYLANGKESCDSACGRLAGTRCSVTGLREATASIRACEDVVTRLGLGGAFANSGIYGDDDSGCTYGDWGPSSNRWVQIMSKDEVGGPKCGEINGDSKRMRVCACESR